ncbi:MAG: homoserine O-acetyltransferase [Candidatus Omnitrophica bacterium]|nr:homoserine O-acetyltransferase [Candidatus Omnitrophota bacterium]
MKKGSDVGRVKTLYFNYDKELVLESGLKLCPLTLAYETYGALNPERSNAVLIAHALSGDAHAAGLSEGSESPGWWDGMIGPGKAFDTDKYFVISSNILGGCRGSTGPSSLNPDTGKPYALDFPIVTVADIVNAQKLLLDYLGIEKVLCVCGGSFGGMQALQWPVSFPGKVASVIPIATCVKHSALQIAFDEVGRQAIMADPDWQAGNYYGKSVPARGLSVARMVGHITYMSDVSMQEKFGRRLKGRTEYGYEFTTEFEVEGYLRYRGDDFVKRFDANSYLYITKAMDYFDLTEGSAPAKKFKDTQARFLVISFSSDWLYPKYQSQEIVGALKAAGRDTTFCEIRSDYGHDAFLLEFEEETHLIKHFLQRVSNGR